MQENRDDGLRIVVMPTCDLHEIKQHSVASLNKEDLAWIEELGLKGNISLTVTHVLLSLYLPEESAPLSDCVIPLIDNTQP